MYLNHYNIEIKPFESSPNPKFLWLGEKHKEALATLKYGIQENKGFILLTGDVGTGKTTLINYFLTENDTNCITTSIPDPDLAIEDLFRLLSHEFGIDIDFETRGEFLIEFQDFLDHTYSDQKKVLLIIDEAQKLNQQILEQIRLLSNIERQDEKLFSIFLVGQNDLHQCLMDEQNRALRQRIAVHCHIEPLTESETRDYINHRLHVAGAKEEIFSAEAISEIFSFSKGCPRLINTICDRALLTGYAKGITQIDCKMVQICADELALPGEREKALEKTGTEVKSENNRKAAKEKPDTVVSKEDNREAADAEPEADADRDAHHDATKRDPGDSTDKYTPFTWGPGAESEVLRVSVEDRQLPSRKNLMRAPRITMASLAVLILTAIALYLWLGA
jgi:general secretion pathway protein A